jgi:hypothetical protein
MFADELVPFFWSGKSIFETYGEVGDHRGSQRWPDSNTNFRPPFQYGGLR